MFFTHATLLCTLLTVSSVLAQDPSATASADPATETSGGFTQCAPANLTFDGGVPPYTIDVLPAGDSSATPLTTVNAPASPYSWLVNVASGTNITLRATDSNGSVVDTNPVVVKPGSDASCLSSTSAPARPADQVLVASSPSPLPSESEAVELPAETLTADDSGAEGSPIADGDDTGVTIAPSATPAPTPLSPAEQSAADAESSKSAASFSAAMSEMDGILASLGGGAARKRA